MYYEKKNNNLFKDFFIFYFLNTPPGPETSNAVWNAFVGSQVFFSFFFHPNNCTVHGMSVTKSLKPLLEQLTFMIWDYSIVLSYL